MNFNRFLALATSTALLTVCPPAFAQDGSDGAAASDDGAVGEIIVTANKREERLQDVPISVSVVEGSQLTRQNINEVTDITRSTPALNSAGPYGALSIRGVGSISFARSAEGSVGVVVDGVALANTSTNPPQLFDVQRVEVLEGPQGTLFGRNSSAGLINIVTNDPNPSKVEAIAHVDVGTRSNYIGRAALNLPVSGNAALRVSGSYSRAPEVVSNRYDGTWTKNEGISGRARFKWEPISELTFNLIGDYSKFDRKGGAPWSVYYSTPNSKLSQRLKDCGVVVDGNNQEACIDGGHEVTYKSYGFSGQVDAEIGDHTLTSITAYRAYVSKVTASDSDSSPVNRLNMNLSPYDVRNVSQELRLTSPGGGFIEYVAGLYYFDSELDSASSQRGFIAADQGLNLPLGQRIDTHSTTTSLAAFGQATLNLTDALRVTLGARYGKETVEAQTKRSLPPQTVAPFAPGVPISASVTDNYFSYRVGAQYDLSRDVMVYGTYTHGYKGPSINDQTGGGKIPLIVRPEVPKAFEVGLKSTLFDGRLAANVALFHTKITDFQAQFYDAGLASFVFGNAPSMTTKGVSVSLFGRPLPGLNLNLGGIYNDATYGKGYLVTCAQGQTLAQGCEPVLGAGGAQIGTADDVGGNRLAGAPKWKVTASAEYVADLMDDLQGFIQTDVVYASAINYNAAYDPINSSDAAATVGGRLGLRTGDERFGVSMFVRNLFDKYREVYRFATPVAAQQLDTQSYSQISGPDSRRTIGVSFDARF